MEEGWGLRDVDENNLSHHLQEEVAVHPQLAGEAGGWDRAPALSQPQRGRHWTCVGSAVQHAPHSLPSSTPCNAQGSR